MPAKPPTASVVIACYNYGRFVGSSIESALGQTQAPVEVIVVDDGSTDESRAVIAAFGARVRGVFQANGGQARAINTGCALASGELVFLLDADDELLPDAIERVAAGWRPDTVMTHARLRMIDATGRPLPGTVPAPWVRLDEGDVRQQLLDHGGYRTSVTSGLAFRRSALERVLPMPEERFRYAADGFLVRAIAFQGAVRAVEAPVGRYRSHGANATSFGATPVVVAQGLRRRMGFMRAEFDAVRELAAQHGLTARSRLEERDADFTAFRLCSSVLDPAGHPFAGDRPLRLLPSVVAATARATWIPWPRRLFSIAMATAIVLLPPVASRLAVWWLSPPSRPAWLRRQSAQEALRVDAA